MQTWVPGTFRAENDCYTARMTERELEEVALSLPAKDRARLAGRLLASLESLSPAEREELWVQEALRRDAQLDRDPSLARDNASVFEDAKRRLGE